MAMISLREMGQGIVSSKSPYDQQLGSFSAFLSPARKESWHRINVENMFVATNQSLYSIENSLRLGLEYNAQILETNYRISTQLDDISQTAYEQCKEIRNTNRILEEILSTLKSPKAVEAAEKARMASQNIAEAKDMNQERAKRLLDEAHDLLVKSIEISPFDYKAHFDLGYLYSFYHNDLESAENSFDTAVLRSLKKDRGFAVYALRHLADTRKNQGKYPEATEALEEAYELNAGDMYQTRFEYAQSLVLNKEETKAEDHVLSLVSGNNEYFDNCAVDPILLKISSLRKKLEHLYDSRFEQNSKNLKSACSWWENKFFHMKIKKIFGRTGYKNFKVTEPEQKDLQTKISNSIDKDLIQFSYKELRDESKLDKVKEDAKDVWESGAKTIVRNKGYEIDSDSVRLGKL